jgi:competence protein ComGC
MTCEPVGVRNQQLEGMLKVMQEQVEHYVQERDEARRSLCECRASGGFDSHDGDWFADDGRRTLARLDAAERGWDCFKETP